MKPLIPCRKKILGSTLCELECNKAEAFMYPFLSQPNGRLTTGKMGRYSLAIRGLSMSQSDVSVELLEFSPIISLI